jgi:hypothetical protein
MKPNRHPIVWIVAIAAAIGSLGSPKSVAAIEPIVEVEEEVYTYSPAENGAGPMWCFGSTCLVRIGDHCFASGLETLEGQPPLNNCRWLLFQRTNDGWQLQQRDTQHRTREPCPLAGFPDGRLFLSANPTLAGEDAYSGPARPEILQFRVDTPVDAYESILPEWQGNPPFTEHSYRSFAADGKLGELILFQNVGYTHAAWTFRDSAGKWAANGELKWPWGADYEKPQPIRICYPSVMLKNREVHFVGVSDIVEPKRAWREYKKKLTGRDWDFDFRRLFYTWTPDITQEPFRPWIEIASRESTGGWISPCDLHVADDGTVHLLWSERAIDTRLRDEFFPAAKQSHSLSHAVLRQGKIISNQALVAAGEEGPQTIPQAGRFHILPDHRILVVYYAHGKDASGNNVSQNRVLVLKSPRDVSTPTTIPLTAPFTSFFTATPRAGSPLMTSVEMLGTQAGKSNTISYARIRFD